MKKLIFSFLAIASLVLVGHSQTFEILEKNAPSQVTFAKPFEAKYILTHDPDYTVNFDPKSVGKDFTISQKAIQQTSPTAVTYDFTVFPFTLGKSTFTITFSLNQYEKVVATKQESIYLEVSTAQTFNDKKFREIRAPRIPTSWISWLLVILLIVAICIVLYLWYRRIKEVSPLAVKKVVDNRPCEVIALEQVNFLINSGIWEQQKYKLFYITLSDILRNYLWKQLKLDSFKDTSAEFLYKVKKTPTLAPMAYEIRVFLNSSDLVKFAKQIPSEQVRNRDVSIIRDIIRQTAPKEIISPTHKKEIN